MFYSLSTAILLGNHGGFRIGELALSSSFVNTILIENVNFSFFSITKCLFCSRCVILKHSKEPKSLKLFPAKNPAQCPVNALVDYLKVRPKVPGPLLVFEDGSPLTRAFVAKHLKALLRRARIDDSKYNAHSLRVGGATDLALEGTPDYIAREAGRWSSYAFQDYMRFALFEMPQVACGGVGSGGA